MQEFNHPHVLSLIGVCLDTGPGVSMVMPFMTNGSLKDYLKKERNSIELEEDDPDKVVCCVNHNYLYLIISYYNHDSLYNS